MPTSNKELQSWVEDVSKMTKPENIYWCNGSKEEYEEFIQKMLGTGDLMQLNEETFPNCYLHRSDPSDVARVCLLYTSPSPRDISGSRMPSSA